MKTNKIGGLILGCIALYIGFLSLLPMSAKAAEGDVSYSLTLPLASHHLSHRNVPDTTKPYNQNNAGIGGIIRWEGNPGFDYGFQIGTYKNSYYRSSNYFAMDGGYNFNKHIRLGVLLGAVSGYGGNNFAKSGYGPLVAPQLTLSLDNVSSMTVTFIPTTIPNGSNALAFSLGYKF